LSLKKVWLTFSRELREQLAMKGNKIPLTFEILLNQCEL
jgi:hypothetical protein